MRRPRVSVIWVTPSTASASFVRSPMSARRVRSTVAAEARKVFQYGRDEIAMMTVLRRQSCGIEIEDVARLGCRFRPGGGPHRQKLAFENGLPIPQGSRV